MSSKIRKRKQQSKGQFNDFVGVWNAYRRKGLLEEWAALGMLYEIIRDNDPTYCRAIMSNLRAFTTAIRERGRRVELEAELAQVKQEQTRGREETEKLRTEIAELRAIVQIQARAATYTGPERRSGLDRRQHPGTSPDGIEHRTGIDRRTDITRNGNHT